MRIGVAVLVAVGAFGASGVPVRAQQVVLNHVVVVVDSGTYRTLGAARQLWDSLGAFQERQNGSADGRSWTGLYLTGRRTYVELFAPGGPAGPDGYSLIGYGVEGRGEIRAIRDRLAVATGAAVDSALFTREAHGTVVPWFHAVTVRGAMTESIIPTWVMEYDPLYVASLGESAAAVAAAGAARQPATGSVRREDALRGRFDPTRPLADVVGIELAVEPADMTRLINEGRAFGYEIEDGFTRVMRGPEMSIRLRPWREGRKGVVGVELRTRLPGLPAGLRELGPHALLDVSDGGFAVIRFRE